MATRCCKSHLVCFLILIVAVFGNTPYESVGVPSESRAHEDIPPIAGPLGNLPERHVTSGDQITDTQPGKIAPQEDINVLEPAVANKQTTNTIHTFQTTNVNENWTEHQMGTVSFGNRLNNDTNIPMNAESENVTPTMETDWTSTEEQLEAEVSQTTDNILTNFYESESTDQQMTTTLNQSDVLVTSGIDDLDSSPVSTTEPYEILQSTMPETPSDKILIAQSSSPNLLSSTIPTSSTPTTILNFGDRITPANITHDHVVNSTTASLNEGTSKAIANMPLGNEQNLEQQDTLTDLKCDSCNRNTNNKPSPDNTDGLEHDNSNIQDIVKDVTSGTVFPANQTDKLITPTRKPSTPNNQTERPRIETTEDINKWGHKKTEIPLGPDSKQDHPANGRKTQTDFTLTKPPTIYMSMELHCTWSYFCLHWMTFQRTLASQLTSVARIDTNGTQIVFFNCDVCRSPPDPTLSVTSWTGPIDVPFYVTDKTGRYSKALTELLAFILMKSQIISIRLHRQEEDSALRSGLEGNPSAGVVAAIAISCIAGICLVFVCILLVILKKRHERQLNSQRCRKVSDGYSLDSISIYSSFTRRRRSSKRSYMNHAFDDPTCPSNKVNFAGLANLSQDPEALAEEFKKIPAVHPRYEDLPPGSELKNRYANIIPVPETRVPLTKKVGDSCSDYINANFIRGLGDESKKYIACQAPLSNTVGDFWRMIWEQQSKVIIMLTQHDEDNVPKCVHYFPPSSTVDFHQLHGDFQITNKKVDSRTDYTISTFQIKNLEKNLVRDITHLWFTSWSSQDIYPDPDSVLNFLLEANSYIASNPGPTVLHCSNGTGRTGAILAIHICMREFIYARMVDIPKCVYRIRQDRCRAVQTKQQYALIYEVLNEYATRVMNNSIVSSRRSSNRSITTRSSCN